MHTVATRTVPEAIPEMTPEMASKIVPDAAATRATDRAAVALSLLCIVHCVALPVVAVALPFVSAFADASWVHWVFALLAILASATVAFTSSAARSGRFILPVSLGAGLVVFGLFAENFGIDEGIPTVIGGVLLVYAHWRRLAVSKGNSPT